MDLNQLGIYKFSKRNSLHKQIKKLRKLSINESYDKPILKVKITSDVDSDSPSISTKLIDECIIASANHIPSDSHVQSLPSSLSFSHKKHRRFSCPELTVARSPDQVCTL